MGLRPVRLTNTQRVMNMMGLDTFGINAARRVRTQAPKAANEYNRILFDIIEAKSTALMNGRIFRSLSTNEQRIRWNRELKTSKKEAQEFLSLQFSGPNDTIRQQHEITTRYSMPKIDKARQALDLEKDLYELNTTEIEILQAYLGVKDKLDVLKVDQKMLDN